MTYRPTLAVDRFALAPHDAPFHMNAMAQYRIQLDKFGWRSRVGLVVAVALGLAATIALVIVSLGVALILLPVVALAVVIGRWRLRQMMTEAEARMRAAQSERAEQQRVIETDYTVIDGERRQPKPAPFAG